MAKNIIIEAQNSNTSFEQSTSKGILGKLAGVFADYTRGTRNSDRLYPEKLWDERVFGSEDVQEALETKTLFGELDHPEGDRCETLAQNAAITITKLEKRPDDGVIYGEAEILDTPTGRIVKALADSGAQLGISSRGMGEEVMEDGQNIIDPDTYDFITFDVVVTPANTKARVSLVESKRINKLTESLKREIKDCETENQLDQVKNVVETINISNKDELNKLIEDKMSEFSPDEDEDNDTDDMVEADKLEELTRKELIDKLKESNGGTLSYIKEDNKVLKYIKGVANNFEKEMDASLKRYLDNKYSEYRESPLSYPPVSVFAVYNYNNGFDETRYDMDGYYKYPYIIFESYCSLDSSDIYYQFLKDEQIQSIIKTILKKYKIDTIVAIFVDSDYKGWEASENGKQERNYTTLSVNLNESKITSAKNNKIAMKIMENKYNELKQELDESIKANNELHEENVKLIENVKQLYRKNSNYRIENKQLKQEKVVILENKLREQGELSNGNKEIITKMNVVNNRKVENIETKYKNEVKKLNEQLKIEDKRYNKLLEENKKITESIKLNSKIVSDKDLQISKLQEQLNKQQEATNKKLQESKSLENNKIAELNKKINSLLEENKQLKLEREQFADLAFTPTQGLVTKEYDNNDFEDFSAEDQALLNAML